MKFRQRQILLGITLCVGVIMLLIQLKMPATQQDRSAAQGHGPEDLLHRDALRNTSEKLVTDGSKSNHTGSAQNAEEKKKGPTFEFISRSRGGGAGGVGAGGGGGGGAGGEAAAAPGGGEIGPAVGDCPKVMGPVGVVTETHTFQQVDGKEGFLVFSAHLDKDQTLVRVISLAESKAGMSVYCYFWYQPHQEGEQAAVAGGEGGAVAGGGLKFEASSAVHGVPELKVMQGAYSALPEHHGKRFTAAYVTCPLPAGERYTRPYAMSLTSEDCRQSGDVKEDQQPSTVLLVQAPAESKPQRKFTVCVTALNYRYSRAYELVEMIELNRILGAELFTFYIHSVGDNVRKILDWYAEQGVVQLIDWKLPMKVDHWPPDKLQPSEVHYFAQLASHNDCLNRHRGSSQYLVYEDLDEFIIPKQHSDWTQLMESLEKESQSAAYTFRCLFFRKDWGENTETYPGKDTAQKFRSIVLSVVNREQNPYSASQRSKYIIYPDRIDAVGIHNIWRYRGGHNLRQVDASVALLHHYRTWEKPEEKAKGLRDDNIFKYKDQLLERLEKVWANFPEVPLDIDIGTYGQV